METLVSAAPNPPVTLEEFLAREDGAHTEWVDGEEVEMSPISYRHQVVLHFLIGALTQFVRRNGLGVIASDPFQIKLNDEVTRAPDIAFIGREKLTALERAFFSGAPDLIVEIISPGSRRVDRGEKFYEYEAAGVHEFWLIDPDRKQVEWYSLGDDKLFHVVAAQDGVFHSRVLDGLWIEEAWLWHDDVPELSAVFALWGVQ